MEESEEYRIVQTADSTFIVERANHYTVRGDWPWSPRIPRLEWNAIGFPGNPFPFISQQAAQKFIDDKRKYPIVVKHPA